MSGRNGGGPAAADPAPESVRLDQAAVDLLQAEVEALLGSLSDGAARSRFEALREGVCSGVVGSERMPELEQLLKLGIQTGRFERVHGRAADTLARGLYSRTPAGRAASEQAAVVSVALEAFCGAVLRAVRVSADGPGGHRITVETDRGQALVRLDRDGVRVDSVETG